MLLWLVSIVLRVKTAGLNFASQPLAFFVITPEYVYLQIIHLKLKQCVINTPSIHESIAGWIRVIFR